MQFQTVAYVRVSSVDQHTDRQVSAVGEVDRTFTDYLSGKSREDRPALGELLEYVREGDTVRVASMDRLARSVIDLAQIVQQCTDKGVTVQFVGEGLAFTKDTANPYAMFQLHMLGAVAQLERSLIRERQRQGIAIAKAKSTYKGRKPVLTAEQVTTVAEKVALKIPKAQIARDLGISRSVLYDALAGRGAYAGINEQTPTPAPTSAAASAVPSSSAPPRTPTTVSAGRGRSSTSRRRDPLTPVGGMKATPTAIPAQPGATPTRAAPKDPAAKTPAKKRARKKWYVVETERQHADNLDGTVAILSECTTAKMAERTRQQLQSKANKDPYRTALIAVRTAEQIHSYWGPYDLDLDRHPITKGPPP